MERFARHLIAERLSAYALFVLIGSWGVWLYSYADIYWSSGGISEIGSLFGHDFLAFWSAADMATLGRAAEAYDPELLKAHQLSLFPDFVGNLPWLYPPNTLLALLPLGLLPYFWALAAFTLVSVLAYTAVIWKVLPHRAVLWPALGFPGLLLVVLFGQNALLITALFGAALLNIERRPVLAGLFLGLLTIKPHVGLLIPPALMLAGHWRCFVSAAVTTMVFFAVSVLTLGIDTLWGFFPAMGMMNQWMLDGIAPMEVMVTFYAHLLRSGVDQPLSALIHGAQALLAASVVLWLWHKPLPGAVRNAALVTGTLLISPYLMKYDLALLALPIVFLTAEGLRTGWLNGERWVLVLMWLLPMLSQFVAEAEWLPVIPLMLWMLLVVIARRALQPAHARPASETNRVLSTVTHDQF